MVIFVPLVKTKNSELLLVTPHTYLLAFIMCIRIAKVVNFLLILENKHISNLSIGVVRLKVCKALHILCKTGLSNEKLEAAVSFAKR